jgi:hypothetical protein
LVRSRRGRTSHGGQERSLIFASKIEAINSLLKRLTGLDRLPVRGRPAVFSGILLKVA